MTSPGEAYVLLGLRLGRHVEGLVEAYHGPPELKEQVDAEPLAEPDDLVAQGDALLAAVGDGWLRDQALGLRTYAGKLAGEEMSYSDEVERCYGVRPERRDTEAYAAAHERLEELLPGEGELAERYQAWHRGATVPADLVVPLVQEAAAEAREATATLVDLPEGERLAVEGVRDEPSTPSALVAEGIAESGPDLVMDDELRSRLVDAAQRHGLDYDAELAEAIARARRTLRPVGVDAALMIHEDGASVEDAEAYVRRWSLLSPSEDAAQSVRFVLLLTEQVRVGELLEAHSDGR